MTTQRVNRRVQAASETRELILRSAQQCFLAQGYPGTTVTDIAAAAGVAVATIYTSVGGKPVLLQELFRRGIEDARVGETMKEVKLASNGRQVVDAIASGTGRLYLQHRDVITLLLENAPREHVAQALLEEAVRAYRNNLLQAADQLDRLGALLEGVDRARAVEILWYFFGLHSWPQVMRDAAWTWDEAIEWLRSTASVALLREARTPAARRH